MLNDYTGLHFLNFFKSQEEELIILIASFSAKYDYLNDFSLYVKISWNFMLKFWS